MAGYSSNHLQSPGFHSMKLTNEQIASIMVKDGKSKTILVDQIEEARVIENHLKEGWKLLKKSELNGRTKLTFEK